MTFREVEWLVLRACQTIRVLPDPEKRWQGERTMQPGMWSGIVQDFMDAYNSRDAMMPKFSPSPADISACMPVLSWCNYLSKNEFRLIWWRSFDVSFGIIATRIGRSDETARRQYNDAVKKVWHASCCKEP